MLRALAVKELREIWGIAALALALFLFVVTGAMGINLLTFSRFSIRTIPFVGDDFKNSFIIVSVCLAIVLGFRQSVWESVRGTYLFLLHRPVSRRQLIGVKLVTGTVLYLASTAVPILAYAWWAATPGTHASPFLWEMTLPIWRIWLSLTVVYLAAFLSGLRPARWYGSRLLPLGVTVPVLFPIVVPIELPMLELATALVADVLLVVGIFHVARTRDFS